VYPAIRGLQLRKNTGCVNRELWDTLLLGALDVTGLKLHLALHIARLPGGEWSGALDSLDQGVNGLPAGVIRFSAPTAHLEWKDIGGVYDATLQNGKLTGTWRQGGQTFPLVFERSATE
jgi:uncharacterized protein